MTTQTDFNKVWYTRCNVPTASGIALDLGWLAERYSRDRAGFGILQDAPLEIALAHYDHSLASLIREGGNVPAIVAHADGAPTRLIGLTFIDEGQAIVAHPDRVNGAVDLRGKRIAVPAFAATRNASHSRAMALGGFEAGLASVGLSLGDVSIVETPRVKTVPPGKLRKELGIKDWPSLHQVADGDADASYIKGAAAHEAAQSLGLKVVVDIDALPIEQRVNNGTPRPLTVHAELLERRPEWVIDFLALTLAAADWASANRDEVISILSRETKATSRGVADLYGASFHRNLAPSLSQERLDLFSIQIDRLARHGFIDRAFDVGDWIEPGVFEAAQARASSIGAEYELAPAGK